MSNTKSNMHVVTDDHTKKQKEQNYKKFLLYGILLVLVVLVGYVLFSDDTQLYKFKRGALGQIKNQQNTTSSNSSSTSNSSSNPLTLGLSSTSSVSAPLMSPTSSASVNVPGVQLSSTSTGGASEVRRELRELFRAYA
jgi:hypothetical protein